MKDPYEFDFCETVPFKQLFCAFYAKTLNTTTFDANTLHTQIFTPTKHFAQHTHTQNTTTNNKDQ